MFLKPLRVLFELLGVSWEPLGSLLEPLGAILGRLGAQLCGLVGLGAPQERPAAILLIFHLFYKGLAAQLPRHVRQQHRGPEPWRGVGGRHKSLPPRV